MNQVHSSERPGDGSAAANGLALAILVGGVGCGVLMLVASAAIVARTLANRPAVVAANGSQGPISPGPSTAPPAVPPPEVVPAHTAHTDDSPDGPTSPDVTPVAATGQGTANGSKSVASPPPAPPDRTPGKVLPPVRLELQLGEGRDLLDSPPAQVEGGQASFPSPRQMELGPQGVVDAAFGPPPGDSYLVDARVQRVSGNGGMMFHLPVDARRTISVAIDLPRQPHPASGLVVIRNNSLHRAEFPHAIFGARLADGQPHDVRIAVLARRLIMQMDNETLVDWGGDFRALGGLSRFIGQIGVGSLGPAIRFERLRVYPIVTASVDPSQPAVVESGSVATGPPRGAGATSPGVAAAAFPLSALELSIAPPVDLLGGIRPTPRGGQISTLGSTMTTAADGIAKAEFVYALPQDYVVEARLKRNSGVQGIAFNLRVGDRPCAVVIDGFPNEPNGPYTGVDMVGGKRLFQNANRKTGPHLESGKAADVRIVVLGHRIALQIDGQTLFEWFGSPQVLAVAGEYRVGDLNHLGIATHEASYTLEKLHVRRITAAVPRQNLATNAPASVQVGPLSVPVQPPLELLREDQVELRQGDIRWQDGSLITSDAMPCRFQFRPPLPENYVIEARLARTSNIESMALSFCVEGRPCALVLDGWPGNGGPISGLDEVDGNRAKDSPLAHKGQLLERDVPVELKLAVLKDPNGSRIVATIDGKTFVDWAGEASRLSENRFTRVGNDALHLGIVTQTAGYRIEKLVLYPVRPSDSPSAPETPATDPPSPPATSLAGAKHPIPTDDAQQPVREKMKSVFGEAIAKAKKPDERAALAREFAGVAETEKDVTTRYVLLQAARKLAVSGLDAPLALELAEQISSQFEVETLALRLESLKEVAAAAGTSAETHKAAAELAATLAEETLDSERYDLADEASTLAFDSAGKARDAELRRQTKELRDDVLTEKKAWEGAQAALADLEYDDTNAAAHLAVGKYYALARDDWPKALAHLAAGSDANLAAAASAEVQAQDAAGQLNAADKWYDAAASVSGADKLALQRHALDLYEAAAPQLSGLDQTKANRRLTELKSALSDAEKTDPGRVRTATRRRRGMADMDPGLIVRTFRGDPPRNPSQVLTVVTSSDEYFNQAMPNVRQLLGNYAPDYFQPVARGYIVLEREGTVQFELMNCVCMLNGVRFSDARSPDTVRVEKKLGRGKHTVVFYRSVNTFAGPQFRVTLEGSSQNILFHSKQDLKIELAKPVRSPQGSMATGVVAYRTTVQ